MRSITNPVIANVYERISEYAKNDYSDERLDYILTSVSESAYYEFQDLTNRNDNSVYTPAMEDLIYQLATLYYDRYLNEVSLDTTSKSQGDVSISFSTDVPERIAKRIMRYRKCPMARLL